MKDRLIILSKIIVWILIFIIQPNIRGQSVLSSSGYSMSSKVVVLDYTIGELATIDLQGSEIDLFQGFHQGLRIDKAEESKNPNVQVKVWPNPTKNVFILKTNSSEISYSLYTSLLQKTSVKGKVSKESEQSIDISNLPSATYLLRVTDINNHSNIYRILKTN
ncbi:T9SS type A sorting domain-containing protein [Aquimarina sp. SS2-1]|uniref:T9SS type A sorting domain-containing protein n=1 Tax=Aquimarina besae TaxID=3342247 RepID=UPI00366E19ED